MNYSLVCILKGTIRGGIIKTCDRSPLVCKGAMPGVIASAWLLLIRKHVLKKSRHK